MKNFAIHLMIVMFAANVFASVAGSIVLCSHSDSFHIVFSSEHARSHSDSSFVSPSECSDVVLDASISHIAKTSSAKTPLPTFNGFLFFLNALEKNFVLIKTDNPTFCAEVMRPPNIKPHSFSIPLLI